MQKNTNIEMFEFRFYTAAEILEMYLKMKNENIES
jgi:hypothetical protein